MCGPAALMIAATAVAATGQVVKGIQQSQQMNYEARVADANAQQQTAAAADAQQRGEIALRDSYRKYAGLKGEQIASMSANGIDTNFGSALQVQRDTSQFAQDDALTIDRNTRNEMRGYEVNAANYTATAGADRAKASGALIDAGFGAAGTILGGAKQYSLYQSSQQPPKLAYDFSGFQ